MRSAEDDPLPFAVWLSEIAALSDHCAVAPPGEEDRAVRRAFHLFKLSAPAIRSLADPYLEESLVELMLEREGAEAAVRLIAGARASFTMAPAASDAARIAAEISFDGGRPVRAEGNSAAYAMIGAWADYFRTAH
jgi:hypothetical protein